MSLKLAEQEKNQAHLRIVLTGGGTAGHVMPNLAILPELRRVGFSVYYIGSGGVEKGLAHGAGIPFFQISTGKLRRYLSVQNVLDIFRIVVGFFQSVLLMLRLKPDVVFSKGGFVAVPVTLAAWVCRIPVVTHESDYSPGLANKIITPFSRKILFTFPETAKYLPQFKSVHVGTPVRGELFKGDAAKGKSVCGFSDAKPILLVMGGSQGAQRINDTLKVILDKVTITYNVVHLTGKGKSIGYTAPGYKAFDFLGEELKDVLSATSVVVSRAGANSIFELLALRKPMLLIPLEVGSRGDQVLNARSFQAHGWAITLAETQMTAQALEDAILRLSDNADIIRKEQAHAAVEAVPQRIADILQSIASSS